MVQWLGLLTSLAGDRHSISGQEAKIPQAMWYGQNIYIYIYILINSLINRLMFGRADGFSH
jgi:hypothetical protein